MPALEVGTVPCNHYTEEGLYFGREGGYVTLSKDLTVHSHVHHTVLPEMLALIMLTNANNAACGIIPVLFLHRYSLFLSCLQLFKFKLMTFPQGLMCW